MVNDEDRSEAPPPPSVSWGSGMDAWNGAGLLKSLRTFWTTIGDDRVRWSSQTFVDEQLEASFRAWFGNGHIWFFQGASAFVAFFTVVTYCLFDLPENGRPGARDAVMVAITAGIFVAWALWVPLPFFVRSFVVRRYDLILGVLIFVGFAGTLASNAVNLNDSVVFLFAALCALAVAPFTRFWGRESAFLLSAFLLCVFMLFLLEDIVDAVTLVILPVVMFIPQAGLASLLIDRDFRRHYALCHGPSGPGEQTSQGKLEKTSQDHREYIVGKIFFRSRKGQPWWRAELAYRHATIKRERLFTTLSLLSFAITSLITLVAEVLITGVEPGYVALVRVLSLVGPLISAGLFASERIALSKFGRLGGLDAVLLLSMILYALSLVWLEYLSFTQWKGKLFSNMGGGGEREGLVVHKTNICVRMGRVRSGHANGQGQSLGYGIFYAASPLHAVQHSVGEAALCDRIVVQAERSAQFYELCLCHRSQGGIRSRRSEHAGLDLPVGFGINGCRYPRGCRKVLVCPRATGGGGERGQPEATFAGRAGSTRGFGV
jgi:hypothetical protein